MLDILFEILEGLLVGSKPKQPQPRRQKQGGQGQGQTRPAPSAPPEPASRPVVTPSQASAAYRKMEAAVEAIESRDKETRPVSMAPEPSGDAPGLPGITLTAPSTPSGALPEFVARLRGNPGAAREAFVYLEIFGPPRADKEVC